MSAAPIVGGGGTTNATRSSCIVKAITSPAKFIERLERRGVQSPSSSSRSSTNNIPSMNHRHHRQYQHNHQYHNRIVLSLDIRRDHIGMALVSPPTVVTSTYYLSRKQQQQQQKSPRLPLLLPMISIPHRRIISENNDDEQQPLHAGASPSSSLQSIHDIVKQHNVCGFVVSWPLERDTGKMGAKCGRVWYTLEALQRMETASTSTSSSSPTSSTVQSSLFSCQRPICLWDPHRTVEEAKRLDEWGRSWEFTRTSTANEYRASIERYYQYDKDEYQNDYNNNDDDEEEDQENEWSSTSSYCDATGAAPLYLWQDFCHAHWPEATSEQEWKGLLLKNDRATSKERTTASSSLPSRSKHLFVDRQLQLAVAAGAY
ncbi:hypothetical protein IV203_034505 [Nitzschia inconspicua]|uniref:Uncharacterized protein n=1 Tax=Nitzschia inconspicua TaxID=303405 RepID=A0A9K3P9K1_9STRA|nr:hypothetical protein IV203_002698 [Nitzschia inconspicua]KAG7339508.1 hypothetical protein IV203_002561 [Nitzschia inconspicua]KAG7359407.1 hypothetical protein IV203_034505 [Nitzschia inconspicua]